MQVRGDAPGFPSYLKQLHLGNVILGKIQRSLDNRHELRHCFQ
jgi:hypothetical protein